MKIVCRCGHIIVDQTDSLPYKAYILPDTAVEALHNGLSAIDSLIAAIAAGKRKEWIDEHFGEDYAYALPNSELIHDLLLRIVISNTQDAYQCENCGMLLVQIGQSQYFRFFRPESPLAKGIFQTPVSPETKV